MKGLVVALSLVIALATCGDSSARPAPSAAVKGIVLATPGCPVEQAGSPCPPIHVPNASVVATRGDTLVAKTRSAADGSFTLRLPSGTYQLTATSRGGYPSAASKRVKVPGRGEIRVTITMDSGIR